jgi:DNA helicase-2/ATP-dependent DNA helicase PcrA
VLEQKVLYSAIPDSSTEQKAAYPITDELQKAAIAHDQGPAVVIAGPGSGKTYVLTERIARLISQNIAPSEKILAITFTTRAAQEMRQRLMSHPYLHQQASSIPISTIHALGLQILREIPPYSSFRLISEAEKVKIIQSFPQAQNQSSAKIANYISLLKNHALNFRFNEVFQEIANQYEFSLHNNQLMDYEDLILLPLNLLKENDQICSQIQNRYRFILVDEFRMLPAQYDFLKIIIIHK